MFYGEAAPEIGKNVVFYGERAPGGAKNGLAKQILLLFTVGGPFGGSFGTLLARLAKQILSLFTVDALLGVLLWHTAGTAGGVCR